MLTCFALNAQNNFTLLGNKTFSDELSDIWGYAANGKEYALVGLHNGVSIVDVTNPALPTELFFIPGNNTVWRDLKTWDRYAYVTNEGGGGLLIVDLTHLPDSISTATWNGGNLGLKTAHNIFIDENGIAYVVGGNFGAGDGALFLDLNTDPMNPTLIGKYNARYVHDVYVRGDTMWTAEIDDGIFSVVDVSNKSNPLVIASSATPGNYAHNLWLSDDGNNLLTTDELSNAYIASFDVSDLSNIHLLDVYQSNPGSGVIPHNVVYKGDFAFISYYQDGVVLLDATYPYNLIEIGNYDSAPQSGPGFNGSWGVYPFLPSGNILATDIEKGLFVLGANYIKACYLEGVVRDTGNHPLNGVTITILGSTINMKTSISGGYATGIGESGIYSVQFNKSGYLTHVENNVVLTNGTVTTLNINLLPTINITFTGQVIDSVTGRGIPNAQIFFEGINDIYSTTADSNGQYSINQFETGDYILYAGHWGYMTKKRSIHISLAGNNTIIKLDSGYYDDFLFDYDWDVSGDAFSGMWERNIPVATSFNNQPSNPGVDIQNDFGETCFITGNGGGSAGNDDVDDGNTILTSPPFNLSNYNDPYIYYSRWFFNDGGSSPPNDKFIIKLSNDKDTIIIETIDTSVHNANTWIQHKVKVSDYLIPSENMRLIFETSDDLSSGHLVEAGVDMFYIRDSLKVGISNFPEKSYGNISVSPNPFNNRFSIHFPENLPGNAQVSLYNAQGKLIKIFHRVNSDLTWGSHADAGIYFLIIEAGSERYSLKLLKLK